MFLVVGTKQAATLTTLTDHEGNHTVRRLPPGDNNAVNQPPDRREISERQVTALRLWESSRTLTNGSAAQRAEQPLSEILDEAIPRSFHQSTLQLGASIYRAASECYYKAVVAKWMTFAIALTGDPKFLTNQPSLLLRGYWEFTGLIWAHYLSTAPRCLKCGGPKEIFNKAFSCCAHYL